MTLAYSLSNDVRNIMQGHEPAVKAAIARLANAKLGHTDIEPEGIYKGQGGVKVHIDPDTARGRPISRYESDSYFMAGGSYYVREIWIDRKKVQDDNTPYSNQATPEERAVVDAIHDVARILKFPRFRDRFKLESIDSGQPKTLDVAGFLTQSWQMKARPAEVLQANGLRFSFGPAALRAQFGECYTGNRLSALVLER